MVLSLTPKQIQRRKNTLYRRIQAAEHDLKMLQRDCTHPSVEKKYGANTGNYDPSADSYWIDWFCPDCTKRWQTDQ